MQKWPKGAQSSVCGGGEIRHRMAHRLPHISGFTALKVSLINRISGKSRGQG